MRVPETSSPRRAPAAGRHRLVLRRLLQQSAYCGACCRRRLIAAPICSGRRVAVPVVGPVAHYNPHETAFYPACARIVA